jgi:hypothetical protein
VTQVRKPVLMLPHRLPWDAQARLMAAYVAECQTIAAKLSTEDRAGWVWEIKAAEKQARVYLALHAKDSPTNPKWPMRAGDDF